MNRRFIIAATALLLAACGSTDDGQFGGTYNGGVLSFDPDGTFEHYRGGLGGQPSLEAAGTWKARGNKVLIIAEGSSLSGMLLGEDGCLREPSGGNASWCQQERY